MPLNPSTKYPWKKHGSRLVEPLLLPGATVSYDGYGLMTFTGSYLMADLESPSDLTTKNFPGQGQEIIKGSGLYISKVSKRYNADKTITLDVEAIGIEKRCNGKTRICIEGMSACSNEPIETHPDFASKIAGTPSQPQNGATFDKDGKFTGFAVLEKMTATEKYKANINSKYPMSGIRSYLDPKVTYRGYYHCDWKTASIVPDQFNRMAGLHTQTGEIMGNELLPNYVVGNGGDFLLTSITPENIVVNDQGVPVIVKVTYELMKAKVVWNELIYVTGSANRPPG